MQRRKDALLVLAEIVARYQVQGGPGLGVVLVVKIRAVPAAALIDLLRAQSEQEEVLGSIVAPSRVPTVSAPFIMNFMLLVPLAS
jgi:hypothetical protein